MHTTFILILSLPLVEVCCYSIKFVNAGKSTKQVDKICKEIVTKPKFSLEKGIDFSVHPQVYCYRGYCCKPQHIIRWWCVSSISINHDESRTIYFGVLGENRFTTCSNR